jgi:hypothetical protein
VGSSVGRALALGLACASVAHLACAQGLPPWAAANHLPLPEDVHSVEILRKDEPLFTLPDSKSPRRGAAALGARLPVFAVAAGAGCKTEYLLVGPTAWICSEATRASSEPPIGAGYGSVPNPDGMPREYYFVGVDGAFGYRDLARAEETAPAAELQPGFAVALTRVASGPHGDPYGLTTKQLWLPLRNLSKVRTTAFHGYETEGPLDRGFVVAETAPAYVTPAGKRIAGAVRQRFDLVSVRETRETGKDHLWIRVGDGEWLDGRDVRVPRLAEPPPEARADERWIDVDLDAQVLTAYEGKVPVFATLVSTGVGQGASETATPKGVHRVWVKLTTTDMTNLEDGEARRYYAMQEVPWVLFFEKGFGLHGAFWHRSFGHVRSHGCVNLTPLDAHRLFDWASPRLPAGWTAALPTDYDPGTLVRVR